MFKVFIVLVVLLLGVSCVLAGPVGCEVYEPGIIKCWNQGSIEPITFFSIDGSQMANNRTDRFNWTHYEMGLAYVDSGGVWHTLPISFLANTITYEITNDSYWLRWRANKTWGLRKANATYTISQGLHDSHVTLTMDVTLSYFHTFPYNISFYFVPKNLDVWNNQVTDVLNTRCNGELISLELNNTNLLSCDNVTTAVNIGEINNSDGGGLQWLLLGEWKAKYFPKAGQVDGDIYIYKTKPKPYSVVDNSRITRKWIDSTPCVFYCPRDCGIIVSSNVTGTISMTQYDCGNRPAYPIRQSWGNTGVGCGFAGCSLSGGCILKWTGFEGGWDMIPLTNYTWNLNCDNCQKASPVKNLRYTRTVRGSAPGPIYYRALIGDDALNKVSSFYVFVVEQCLQQNVTLWEPKDFYVGTAGEVINFNCTREAYWTDWLALYINDTMYRNESSRGFENITESVQLNQTGIYEWDCKSYTYGNSSEPWSWNGNFSLKLGEAAGLLSGVLTKTAREIKPNHLIFLILVVIDILLIVMMVLGKER